MGKCVSLPETDYFIFIFFFTFLGDLRLAILSSELTVVQCCVCCRKPYMKSPILSYVFKCQLNVNQGMIFQIVLVKEDFLNLLIYISLRST